MTPAIRLFDRPHADARALVATGAPVHLLIDPIEYHGPHLPLHNDRIIATGLATALHERLHARRPDWPFLLGDDLEIGVEPTSGRGTRHTPFEVAREVVREACRALAELGAQRVILGTFHGAPLHNLAIEAGVEVLREAGVQALAPFNAVLRELTQAQDGHAAATYAEAFAHVDDGDERAEMMRDLHLDFHGGFFETSLTLHFAPDSVSKIHRDLPPCPPIRPHVVAANAAKLARLVGRDVLSRELTLAAWGLGWKALDPFPGYTGRPHRATAGAGAVFARHIVDRYEALVDDVLLGSGRSPLPIMTWSAALTANGRLTPSL